MNAQNTNNEIIRAIHIDFHTQPGIETFGRDFDAEVFAARLSDAHVRYINTFAKCNLGFCYFPTETGVPYPTMQGDRYGEILAACTARGIGVTAYFNLGLDHEQCRRHREWCRVSKDGEVISGDRTGNWFRSPCLSSPYGDYMLRLIEEVVTRYPATAGIFLDCIHFTPCYGNECLEEIAAAGGDPTDDETVRRHTEQATLAFLHRVKALVGGRNLFLNGVPFRLARDLDTHLEVECLPSGAWGYDYFGAHIAYARTLSDRVVYMTGRFQQDWGDFGGFKPKASIENDVWDALMNGAVCSVGDHMDPSGNLDETLYRTVGEIYREVERLEPWTHGAHACSDIAVLCPVECTDNFCGAARMLAELHLTFDIVRPEGDFSSYRMLIVPDNDRLSDRDAAVVRAFADSGRPVLCVGRGGVYADRDELILGDRLGCRLASVSDASQVYYKATPESAAELGTATYAAYLDGVRLTAEADDVCVIANTVSAYFDRHFDGFHGYFYLPPKAETGEVTAVLRGSVGYIAPRLFQSYYENAYVANRDLFAFCVRRLLPDPQLTAKGLPHTARVGITRGAKGTLLHIKTTYPELRGRVNVIEAHNVLPAGAQVTLRGEYQSAVALPSQAPLQTESANGHTTLTLPQINGYICIALQ